ncbi:amidohydrolase family protein [Cryobacterium sp. N19]|uniref:amidohydrolase family protein n=1 Tax=Cryobacterium sp. N19 TaxID=2048288 RepID=UPI000CE4A67A|nr:amidohydrolase family protein [Cryobacterium sp. N19]
MTDPDLVIRSERVLTAQGFIPAAVCVTNGVITAILPIDAVIDAPSKTDVATPDQAPTATALRKVRLAWGGISGLQVSLAAVWSAGLARGLGLEQVVEWMSAAPARFVGLAGHDGLAGKGAIAVGADADLVAFAPAEEFLVDAESLRHKNKVSAFDGALLVGRVHTTWLAGREVFSVYDDVAGRPTGALLMPEGGICF